MDKYMNAHRAAQIVAVGLITIVVLQVLYMALLGGPGGSTNADIVAYFTDRWTEVATVWTVEAVAFVLVALGGLVAMVRGGGSRIAWAAVALAGVFNLVQIGIGLSLFKPVALAGEEHNWMFLMIVGGAFWFYFLAKMFLGIAAIGLGLSLLKMNVTSAAKLVAGIAVLAGIAAVVTNIAGMAAGMGWVMYAGISGTLCAILVAITGLMAAKRSLG